MPEPLKIFNSDQIKAAYIDTKKHGQVAPADVMEKAAISCTTWIKSHFSNQHAFKFFCGMSDKGSVGLAMARHLSTEGYDTDIYVIKNSDEISENFKTNLSRLLPKSITDVTNGSQLPAIAPHEIIIDAIWDTVLDREVTGLAAECITCINTGEGIVISIDIPSGLNTDKHTKPSLPVINADYTLTFQFPKVAFLFAENAIRTGKWDVLDIGVGQKYIAGQGCKKYYITKEFAASLLKEKQRFAHKGTFGHALLMAGSYGQMGAAILAAKACLRSGVGLLSIHTPECGYNIVQASVIEALADMDSGEKYLQDEVKTVKYDSIGIGPGIGTKVETQIVVEKLLKSDKPLVIDADALNIMGMDKARLKLLPENCILTPHPKEFKRITRACNNDFERHELQLNFSKEHKVYVVLKGAHTCITTPSGEAYFNSTGNPGMAKGGSGDILTGILTGLLAQGYEPLHACILGVYIHGLAGDITAKHIGETAMKSGDIIDFLSDAQIQIEKKS